MSHAFPSVAVIGAVLLSGCAIPPPVGPSVMALPAQGKTLAEFQQDDALCQQFAAQQTGYNTPAQAAADSGIGSAAIGTVLGAAAGALIGAAAGNPGIGAAIGAGTGLLVGSSAGVANAEASGAALQQRYDQRYIQCMSARGESVPVGPAVTASSSGYRSYPYRDPYPYYGPSYGPGYYYGPPVSGGVYFYSGSSWGGHGYHRHHW